MQKTKKRNEEIYMSVKDEMDLLLAEREIKVGTKKFIVKKISMLKIRIII